MTPNRAHKIRAPKGEARPVGRSVLILHASELLTLAGSGGPRIHEAASELGVIDDGAVYTEGERIVDVGPTSRVLASHPRAESVIDAAGKVVLPGFVDAHTHAVFAGSREREVEWKAQGLSYADIAARGGGILHTVKATRDASEASLANLAADRLRTMRSFGSTTVEVKSGYGLRTEDELKMLRAADEAGRLAGVDVVRTFLGAHAIPLEYEGRADAYVELLTSEALDAVASYRMAAFCDVFVEGGYFTAEQGRKLLATASLKGLRPKVHADELTECGGAALAAEVRAASADHLLHASDAGIEGMARAGTVATLLPATSLASRMPFADGRKFLTAGVPVALGTDFNPNCWCESMQLVIALACHYNGLTPAQAIVAATANAACAVGREKEVGSLEPGKVADLLVLDVPTYAHLGYRIGGNLVEVVVTRGIPVDARGLNR